MNENEWYKIFELLFKTNKESNKNSNGYNSKFYKRYYYIFYINLNLLTLLNSPFFKQEFWNSHCFAEGQFVKELWSDFEELKGVSMFDK